MFDFDLNSLNLDLKEIDKLISEVEKEITPIIRKTPEMIEKNPNPADREKELVEFSKLHNYYITPLSELTKKVCTQLKISYSEIPSFSNHSIIGRMSKLCEFLISKGCGIDSIKQLFPETTKEVDDLFEQLKNLEIPLIRKTPEMIEKNSDLAAREKELVEFTLLHDIYITPLSEMAKRISIKLGLPYSEIPIYSNLSISGRMFRIRDFLLSKGCTLETLTQLLPRTEEHIQILTNAKKYGFDMGFNNILDLTNDNRVERAKHFLLANGISDLDSIKFSNNGKGK